MPSKPVKQGCCVSALLLGISVAEDHSGTMHECVLLVLKGYTCTELQQMDVCLSKAERTAFSLQDYRFEPHRVVLLHIKLPGHSRINIVSNSMVHLQLLHDVACTARIQGQSTANCILPESCLQEVWRT